MFCHNKRAAKKAKKQASTAGKQAAALATQVAAQAQDLASQGIDWAGPRVEDAADKLRPVLKDAKKKAGVLADQAQDLAHRVLLGRAREHVAAALATHAREHVGAHERSQDVLEIFLGNPLSRRDLFERDATGCLVLGQIDHNAQGISALSRNQHV